jgi:limonene-1,2-epoxide hydrolase
MTMANNRTQELAERLRDVLHAFASTRQHAVERLAPFYDPEVVFRDPLQTLHGREAFLAMNRRIVARASHLSFDVREALGSGESLFLAWSMDYRPRGGPAIVFEGATHARVRAGLIVEHRDYWDLLSSVALSLPILRRVYASLAPHLA